MLYAVTVEPLNAVYFVSDRPDDNPWEVQEGVELEIDPLYGTWTPDLGPLHQTLCVSTSNPKYFRVFLHSRDPGIEEYRPTGRDFAGFFSKAAWERIAKSAPGIIRALCTGDDEPLRDAQEAVAATAQGG
jgi:hypothetical protein